MGLINVQNFIFYMVCYRTKLHVMMMIMMMMMMMMMMMAVDRWLSETSKKTS